MSRTMPEIDVQFKIRTTHKSGFLAGLLQRIGETGGVLGDIETQSLGKKQSVRNVTISVFDDAHRQKIEDVIRSYAGAELLESRDVVFERHIGGKIRSGRTKEIKNLTDLRYFYTPGVARVCKRIQAHPEEAVQFTNIGSSVAVISNGTRVLGLGDIGALASMPVMEGKAMIYDQFVGLSATPILINTTDQNEFINIVEKISLTFGGIHLEDIRVPDCFAIEDELQRRLNKPVMHDDQHGTGTVCLAAILSSLRITGKKDIKKLTIAQLGLGAAGFGIAKLLVEFGFTVIGADPNPEAGKRLTDIGGTVATLAEAVKAADIVVATTGKVGVITQAMIRKGQIILAISNPEPEISTDDALEAGAAFAADGSSVNNALAYPGLFKAALTTGARRIDATMKIAAAKAIAGLCDGQELLPSIFHPDVHKNVFEAVSKVSRK